jgi:hypothetical protein
MAIHGTCCNVALIAQLTLCPQYSWHGVFGSLQVVVSVQHARTKSRCIRAQRDAITYYSPDDATLGDVLRQTILADKPCPACGNVRGNPCIGISLHRFICVAAGVGDFSCMGVLLLNIRAVLPGLVPCIGVYWLWSYGRGWW